jgi:translation initiation factor 3 subunit E
MASSDLTHRMSKFFDRHLVFPLLEFLSDRANYSLRDITEAKLQLLSNTNMVDYMMEVYKELHGTEDVPKEMSVRRDGVVNKLKELQLQIEPIVKILEQDQVAEQLSSSRDRDGKQMLDYLVKNYDFHPRMLSLLYEYAKLKYECGDYEAAGDYLNYYRSLVDSQSENFLHAVWGKFASEILCQNWEMARNDFMQLKSFIDGNTFETELELLQNRAWLIHWSLYVFHNHPKGRDDIIDNFLKDSNYLNTIQILCPHILRYVTVAVVVNKKRQNTLKDLVRVIQLESHHYKDAITGFIECLYVNYDFNGAQKKLRDCEEELRNDFFLINYIDDFIDCARLLVFEMFCRIHQCISISNLAEKLNMEPDKAERWIVNLIRNARLDAKIDSQLGTIIMGTKTLSIHEQVMENTKLLTFRAQTLAHHIEKTKNERQVMS